MSSRSKSRSRNVISQETINRLIHNPIGTHGSMSASSKKEGSLMNTLSRSIRGVFTTSRRRGGKRKNTKRKTQKKRKTRKVRRNQK
jgi:hypothetical protein